jgi:hypothetical protein
MTDIDEMDVFHYFEVAAYGMENKERVATGYIEDVM